MIKTEVIKAVDDLNASLKNYNSRLDLQALEEMYATLTEARKVVGTEMSKVRKEIMK